MKQTMQMRMATCITPQLQQAIRLLRLSTLDLQTEIRQALDSNIMLEVASDPTPEITGEPPTGLGSTVRDSSVSTSATEPQATSNIDGDAPSLDTLYDYEGAAHDAPMTSDWDDAPMASNYGSSSEFQRDMLDVQPGNTTVSLQEHLLEQVTLSVLTEVDKAIAYTLVDAVSPNGYLGVPLSEIQQSLAEELAVEADEVEAVLHWVQSLDPPGVGARDLRECLTLQLRECDPATPGLEHAKQIVTRHLESLAAHNHTQIERAMDINKAQLQAAIACIRSLNPLPGSGFEPSAAEYVTPDIYVSKKRGRWHVELNPHTVPNLRVNPYYAGLLRQHSSNRDLAALKAHAQEARWFIKALQSRGATVLQVATAIVERQRAFLDYGEEAMQPLVLHNIADALGMHESTVSRATSRKYMHTPRGVYELKYFFSSHVSNSNGNEFSSTAIRALVKKLIAAESHESPMSDSMVAALLAKQGIEVARRTIAKYRDELGIPPANDRKRIAYCDTK